MGHTTLFNKSLMNTEESNNASNNNNNYGIKHIKYGKSGKLISRELNCEDTLKNRK